jgi:preprotein translocase subunit SecE
MADGKAGQSVKAQAAPRPSVGEFVRQVRQESRKITWPSRKETLTTSAFVGVFSFIMAIFFLGVDQLFGFIVKTLVGLIG